METDPHQNELKRTIREIIKEEIIANLSITWEEGLSLYGEKEPDKIVLRYKNEIVHTEYVE